MNLNGDEGENERMIIKADGDLLTEVASERGARGG